MESIQLIKTRIKSISSTRQITQSMRLVSTSKVQKARARMLANSTFLEEGRRLVRIAQSSLDYNSHPFLRHRPVTQSAIIIISSDRGLCGGYSTNVGREAMLLMDELGPARVITVGAKARDYCRRRRELSIAHSFTGVSENPFFEDAREIADMALEWYASGEVDQVYMVHTEFKSMLLQIPKRVKLLPLEPLPADFPRGRVQCEPDADSFLEKVVPFYLYTILYGAMLEASACEQSARITSMDSAVKNADEMIESLTLRFNQARQGIITQELIEIVSGAGAVR